MDQPDNSLVNLVIGQKAERWPWSGEIKYFIVFHREKRPEEADNGIA